MGLKIKITNAERFDSLPDNATYIDVSYDIIDLDEKKQEVVIESFRESFSLKSTRADIQKHLEKKLKSYTIETAQAEKQADIDETFEQADVTMESLIDLEITSEEIKEEKE